MIYYLIAVLNWRRLILSIVQFTPLLDSTNIYVSRTLNLTALEYKFHNGEPTLFITEVESKVIEGLRLEYAEYLYSIRNNLREELTDEYIVHHFREANIYELERLRADIFFGKYSSSNINPYYRDLVELSKGEIRIIKGDLFNSFAMSYNIIEDNGEIGRGVLVEVLRYHIINWMILNDCSTGAMPDIRSITVKRMPQRPKIFLTIETEDFYKHFASEVHKRDLSPKPMLSIFYNELIIPKQIEDYVLGVVCKKKVLAEYWNVITVPQLNRHLEINKKSGSLQLLSESETRASNQSQFDNILLSYINLEL